MALAPSSNDPVLGYETSWRRLFELLAG